MKIIYLVTHIPGASCGVVDYTKKLCAAVRAEGADANIEILDDWSFRTLFGLLRKYKGHRGVIFHLQYPTLGMGYSIAPAALPFFLFPIFTTLHEFTVFHLLRKAIFLPHAILAKKITFTNENERRNFLRFFPLACNATIIPIGENITAKKMDAPPAVNGERIIYFGQIAPDKGIELFIDTVKILKKKDNTIKAAIIGSVLREDSDITRRVRRSATEHAIDLILNEPSDVVSEELQKSTIALLPFPDGITEKRGSALACIKHGLPLITVHSSITPPWMKKISHSVKDAQDAAACVAKIMEGRLERHPEPAFLKENMMIREWPNIAQAHIALYRSHAKA